jgi:hypothetical protein
MIQQIKISFPGFRYPPFSNLSVSRASIWMFFLILLYLPLHAQNQNDLNGTVYDLETGALLEGATVVDLGTGRGTIASVKGTFSIKIQKPHTTLRISYLGYASLDTLIDSFFYTRQQFFVHWLESNEDKLIIK